MTLKDRIMTFLGRQRTDDPAKHAAIQVENDWIRQIARKRHMTPEQVRDAIAVRRMRRMRELARRAEH